jgi:hypothetical protein
MEKITAFNGHASGRTSDCQHALVADEILIRVVELLQSGEQLGSARKSEVCSNSARRGQSSARRALALRCLEALPLALLQ